MRYTRIKSKSCPEWTAGEKQKTFLNQRWFKPQNRGTKPSVEGWAITSFMFYFPLFKNQIFLFLDPNAKVESRPNVLARWSISIVWVLLLLYFFKQRMTKAAIFKNHFLLFKLEQLLVLRYYEAVTVFLIYLWFDTHYCVLYLFVLHTHTQTLKNMNLTVVLSSVHVRSYE